jgi:hypothetical protein
MTFKELKQQIKKELKEKAQIIRRGKFLRKPGNRAEGVTKEDKKNFYYSSRFDYFDYWKVKEHSHEFRHMHIAYCQFFNKTPYNMIEPYCENMPREYTIKNYMTKWESKIDEEIICDHAA